ncbi:putative phage tail protein [Paenibacillus sp. SYP-B4298]|uniref:putative phage tail protein n=1 Tax=Paenibacillus sp. SYP-B4298 TaxID=2996034 RepID=UPI0022DE7F75|nr:putative phage tail protein [Paenibacillus sp. SYP-B4298]
MSNPVKEYWPEIYQTIKDFEELAKTEDVELQLLEGAVAQQLADQFVLTSTVQAIRRRELMLGIKADPTTETLEFRRRRILNRYQTKPPFTIRFLQQQLDMLAGSGMTLASVDVQNFILTITTNVSNAGVFAEISHTVETTKPANLVYQQIAALDGEIELEEQIGIKSVSWQYKLDGSWQLGATPFATYGAEVAIK